jgi:hypothetical protein
MPIIFVRVWIKITSHLELKNAIGFADFCFFVASVISPARRLFFYKEKAVYPRLFPETNSFIRFLVI